MENNLNQCYRCKNWNRYYTKGVKKYNQTKIGWCCKKCKNLTIHESCEKFVIKPNLRKDKRLLKCYLSDLLTEITEIRKIIEEENNETKEL